MCDDIDKLIFGSGTRKGLLAVDHIEGRGDSADTIVLHRREGAETVAEEVPFKPFCWVQDRALLEDFDPQPEWQELKGRGELRHLAIFPDWKTFKAASAHLRKASRKSKDSGDPYLALNDPVQQYLLTTGETLFKGLHFNDLRRMQVDIETLTTPGYEFSNAERPDDTIIAMAMADNTGWTEVLSLEDGDEKALLEKFFKLVRERDPDVIEGHNFFNFDWPFMAARAKRAKVKPDIGRGRRPVSTRPSRFSAGDRTISYTRLDIPGRHVVDTYFLVQLYDISYRALESFSLKECARHFGLAPEGRTYIEGPEIAATWREQPERVLRYARDDIIETRALAALLSPIYFHQAGMLPFGYQNVCVRGNATKIDALMLRAAYHRGKALPIPGEASSFEGGYTDMFIEGLASPVHHCDVRSLYPSLMLARGFGPRSDEDGIFLELLRYLREVRLDARKKSRSGAAEERQYYDAMQSCFKILINSFYGYLGFSQARFCDFEQASAVAAAGREVLRNMVERLRELGAKPIEIDTDGIYYIPPDFADKAAREAFENSVRESLPSGLEIEFDGDYRAMFSYKMKNYALLDEQGRMTIKGAALKSRGLEPFQREYLREYLRLRLEGRDREVPALQDRCRKALLNREWPIEKLARREQLQTDPKAYAAKRDEGKTPRRAAFEVALKSGREYRAGDTVTYYITGNRKTVAAHEAARPVSDWNPDDRDENIPYYQAKLEALFDKFGTDQSALQGELF